MAPFSFDEPAEAPRIVPAKIACPQHGDLCRVFASRILTMNDNRRAVFAFAICGERTALRRHEFGEFCHYVEVE